MKKKLNSQLAALTAAMFFTLPAPGAQAGETAVFHGDKIIISATKTEHSLGTVPVNADVITAVEMKQKNIKTVQDALRSLTGIRIVKDSGSWGNGGNVELMGLGSSKTLILVDGQRVLGGHGGVDISAYSVEMIERIEVVKGSGSALYGSDAMGGVVNIITKTAPDKPYASASAGFGSHNAQVHEASAGIKHGKIGGNVNYTYSTSDGINEIEDRYTQHVVQGDIGYDFSQAASLHVKPFYSKKNGRDYDFEKGIDQTRNQERMGLNSEFSLKPDDKSRLTARGGVFSHDHWTADHSTDTRTDSVQTELDYTRLIMNNQNLTTGYEFNREKVDDKVKKYTSNSQDTHSLFLQDEIDLDPFVVVLGVRTDKHEEWGTQTNPKASVLFRATEKLKFRGSVGTAFRAPSMTKLYADGWKMGPWTWHANPDLDPEESVNWQAGIEYNVSKNIMTKVSWFRNDIDNLITNRKEITRGHGRPEFDMYFENVDEAVTQGIEFSLSGRIAKNLTAELGYTWLDTENKATGDRLLERPDHRATISFNWMIKALDLNVNLNGEYVGKRDFQASTKSPVVRIDDYEIVNLAFTRPVGKHCQLFARLDNVFDKKGIEDEYDIDGTEFFGGIRLTY
jgi:outer membrane cobalamin receptor